MVLEIAIHPKVLMKARTAIDSRNYVYPEAEEICNGQFDNCNYRDADEPNGGIPSFERDDDSDGYVECSRTDLVEEWFGQEGYVDINGYC